MSSCRALVDPASAIQILPVALGVDRPGVRPEDNLPAPILTEPYPVLAVRDDRGSGEDDLIPRVRRENARGDGLIDYTRTLRIST
jgi:hypothetical protein